MRGRTGLTAVASMVLGALAVVTGPAPAQASDPLRILIVGDSISQGSAGDWTWRYRLWEQLTGAGVDVDLLGQRDDLYDNVAKQFANHDYLDPAFDTDHAARWGMLLGQMDRSIGDLVTTYHPDVVLELLGDNDLSDGKTPAQVAQLLHTFVDEARAADSGVDVVLGQDPRPNTQPTSVQLNTQITQLAAQLDSPSSRVVATSVSGYDDLQDTWDGAHPNARGELKLAAGFEDALHQISTDLPAADPIPTVPLGPRIPPVLSGTAALGAVQLDWVRSPGAQKSDVWVRDVTAGEAWHKVAADVTGTTYTLNGLDWHVVQVYTVPYKGFWPAQSDAWSNVVEAEVLGELGAPTATASATAAGEATVGWGSVPHATSYDMQWRRADQPNGWLGTTTSTSTSSTVTGLTRGVGYAFRVRATHATSVGSWSQEAMATVPDDPLRILVVGDSITQGSAGDWTWRYRLWKHLTGAGLSVDFVGPRSDLFDNVGYQDGDTHYVDPAFDTDHAARWGTSLGLMAEDPPIGIGYTIGELVGDYQPDVVLELLGVNDLTFLGGTPTGVRDALHDFVDDARAADPGVELVLGRIPRTNLPQVSTFNQLVSDLGAELDSPASRVAVAETDAGYDEAEDTWDGGHPDSRGELEIAAAFEDALSSLEIGPAADRPLPDVPRGPRIAPVLSAAGQVGSAHLTWVRSPGSTESEVWVRDVTASGEWSRAAEHLSGTSYDVTGLPAWHRIEVRTEPLKGSWRASPDAWSNVVGVDVVDDHLDAPGATAATVTAGGVATVRWTPVPGATSYAVQWRRKNQPGAWLGTVPGSGGSATVDGLANRTGYSFRAVAQRPGLWPAFSDDVSATVPALAAVTDVRVHRTRHGVRTVADTVASATTYTLRVARAHGCRRTPGAQRFGIVASGLARPARTVRFEARAVWVRWVAVRDGVEGDLDSGSTGCVRLAR